MASANVRWPFYSSPFHSSVGKVSLHHFYERYFDSNFSINVEAAGASRGYHCGLLPKEEPFKTKVELPLISSYVYLIHSLLRMYEL